MVRKRLPFGLLGAWATTCPTYNPTKPSTPVISPLIYHYSPPREINQRLPYGLMRDDQMRGMPVAQLQDNGVIFLWVTGEG